MAPQVAAAKLRFEHHPNGLGIPFSNPRLSWRVEAIGSETPKEWRQTGYEVQVKRQSSGTETFKRDSQSTVLVDWPASPLKSCERVAVRVRSIGVDSDGPSHTEWSEWGTVEVALLDKGDLVAKTIAGSEHNGDKHPDENGPRPWRFRKTFEASTKPSRSRLYVTALGVYEAFLNGKRIGEDCLAPTWTSYQHRIQIQVFDVSDLVTTGSNTLVIEVAPGWYSGRLLWLEGVSCFYGDKIGSIAQLELYGDESATRPTQRVVTDESWECALSPVVASSIYDGETYDMRLEYDSLDREINKSLWKGVEVIETPEVDLVASASPAIRVTESLKPVSIDKDPDGKILVNFGQNLVGRVRIPSLSKADGHCVVIKYAEVLEKGKLGTRPLRCAKATDTIIFDGTRKLENWVARFTYHGFQYIEITGWSPEDDVPLTKDSIVAEVIHTEMDRTGYFSCSDPKVNQLHQNVVWSMRGNFVGIPTDCPQRDERLGWTGDIQVFTPTASYIYDCGGMLSNWMRDVVAETRAGKGIVPLVVPNAMRDGPWPPIPQAVWDDVIILTPWNLYRNFGDAKVLKDSWEAMVDYLEALHRGEDGLWDANLWQLGDWLDPNAPPSDPGLARTDGTLVADEYLVYVTSVMAKIATVLGLSSESTKYQDETDKLKQAFQDKYVAKSGLVVGDSQTSLALSIVFDLHTDGKKRKVAAERLARLVKYAQFQVSTGFAGTPVVLNALSKGGLHQVAYRMLLEEKCPSWLYPVSKGATTIWERWDSMLEDGSINPGEMTSFNHYALGSVAEWLHTTVGGISPIEPGWKKFRVNPVPGGTITEAAASFDSPNGTIKSEWRLKEDGKAVHVNIRVPPNTTAVVESPEGPVEVGSGNYSYDWEVTLDQEWPPKPLLTQFQDA